MSLSLSQGLTIAGLILELSSTLWVVRKLFNGYYKRIDEMGKPMKEEIRRDRREGAIVVLLLVAGMILQGLAIFY